MAHKTIHRCDRLVVLTEGLRNLVIDRYGASPERVLVIPSGSDTELFTPCDRLACRQRVGLDVEAEYIGFVGSFYQYQGLTCLLDAFALIREQKASVRLLLVGDGEAGRSLQEQAAKLDLAGAIVWTGRVPYAQVPDLIGAMDVCAAPFSADRGETSPVKLFDYLACGRPTVASAIPAVSKIFSDGQGVVLVPPDNPSALASALLSLLENPQRAAELGQHGRRFVEERYGWGGLTERLRQWLQRDPSLPTHANSSIL
jgi:glycosyltransferase involved in cell wall biosynthesis